jgi:hypothetical protein
LFIEAGIPPMLHVPPCGPMPVSKWTAIEPASHVGAVCTLHPHEHAFDASGPSKTSCGLTVAKPDGHAAERFGANVTTLQPPPGIT